MNTFKLSTEGTLYMSYMDPDSEEYQIGKTDIIGYYQGGIATNISQHTFKYNWTSNINLEAGSATTSSLGLCSICTGGSAAAGGSCSSCTTNNIATAHP